MEKALLEKEVLQNFLVKLFDFNFCIVLLVLESSPTTTTTNYFYCAI